MSVNLLQLPLLQPQITCSTVSLDGHDVSNLLALPSSVPRLRSGERGEGFIAETFVKPPVNLTITFAYNVDVDRVIVDGRIGTQRSTGMELYTASVQQKHLSGRSINFDDVPFQCIGRAHLQYEPFNNNKSQNPNDNVMSNDDCLFTFVNKKFRPHLQANTTIDVDEGTVLNTDIEAEHTRGVYAINHRLNCYLSAVSAICLRVTRTHSGSAVTVRRIEVWGQVSGLRDATRATTESLALANSSLTNYGQRVSERLKSNELEDIRASDTRLSKLAVGNSLLPANTPLEFLDAVTHEVMTCPLLLPCGQIVDKTTLDRFNKEEANWGRAPSDPFTGKPFTSDNKPVVSDALKTRLDRFILRNADEIWNESGNRSYVLGRAADLDKTSFSIHSTGSASATASNDLDNTSFLIGFTESATTAASCSRNGSVRTHSTYLESPTSPVAKRLKTNDRRNDCIVIDMKNASSDTDVVSLSSNDSDVESSDNSSHDKSKIKHPKRVIKNVVQDYSNDCIRLSDNEDDCIDVTDDVFTAGNDFRTSSSVNHETVVSSSLESALQSTLAALPSFTRGVIVKPTVPQRVVAACCKCDGRDTAALYTLACRHLICRSCLLASMKSGLSKEAPSEKCSSCEAVIVTHLATKAHFP